MAVADGWNMTGSKTSHVLRRCASRGAVLAVLLTLAACGRPTTSQTREVTFSSAGTDALVSGAHEFIKEALTDFDLSTYARWGRYEEESQREAAFFKLYKQYSQHCGIDFNVALKETIRPNQLGESAFSVDMRARRKDQPVDDRSILGITPISSIYIPERTSPWEDRLPKSPSYRSVETIQSATQSLIRRVLRTSPDCAD
jgi:hypothetical protein